MCITSRQGIAMLPKWVYVGLLVYLQVLINHVVLWSITYIWHVIDHDQYLNIVASFLYLISAKLYNYDIYPKETYILHTKVYLELSPDTVLATKYDFLISYVFVLPQIKFIRALPKHCMRGWIIMDICHFSWNPFRYRRSLRLYSEPIYCTTSITG